MTIGAVMLRFRGSRVVSAKEDVVPAQEIVLYRQDDERWINETLGDSSYTMGKSGCLVSCIASAVTMTKEDKTPLTLNKEFTAHNVFDAEGNILWNSLRNTGEYEVDVFKEAPVSESAEAILETTETIHPLYTAFLRNEISVPNPYVTGSDLSFFDDRIYSQEEHTFENAAKCFSLVDVNNDGGSELVFKIYDYPDVLMYILGIQGDKLICYDVYETHTSHMAFGIYDNGIVTWGQNYDGDEEIYYSFDSEGKPYELIHFVREDTASDSDLFYDYYYFDGDETTKCILQSNEEYKNLISPYEGEEPEWFFCNSFADIPEE